MTQRLKDLFDQLGNTWDRMGEISSTSTGPNGSHSPEQEQLYTRLQAQWRDLQQQIEAHPDYEPESEVLAAVINDWGYADQ